MNACRKMAAMRVLVIGGTQLSGPYLVRELLNRGHEVSLFHRGYHETDLPTVVAHIHGDLRDTDALKAARDFRPQGVVHMYAMKPADVERAIEAFAGRLERFVLISSGDVYAAFEAIERRQPSSQPIPIPEGASLRIGPYRPPHEPDYDKIGAERVALAAAEAGMLPAAIMRLPAIYGPGAVREWYWVKRVLDGRSRIALPDGGLNLFHRGFAASIAHGIALALESGQPGRVYNVGDEAVYSVRQITDMIAVVMRHSWDVVSIPATAWPYGTPYSIPNHLVYDLSRIKDELGYRDVVEPEEGLRLTVDYLVANQPDVALGVHPRSFDYAAEDAAVARFAV
jgi:nucleoside-diphosphate-sugar epimerase